MRIIFILSIKVILVFSFAFSQIRYKDEIFSEVIKTEDVVYANAPDLPFNFAFEWFTSDIDLTMDVYEAVGDTVTNRPVIVFMHSGAWFEGSNEADDMVALSISSAKIMLQIKRKKTKKKELIIWIICLFKYYFYWKSIQLKILF